MVKAPSKIRAFKEVGYVNVRKFFLILTLFLFSVWTQKNPIEDGISQQTIFFSFRMTYYSSLP